ncbi:choline/ethanolamine kinase-like [Oppia nitens]|uniref:choline/ethanolamine kinase-like n=1 Tax=Oppia nitens TaxID=1686743 RepID=UPI0023D98284|nr:choline/ethanolamine kinase-like [Oppia nitens]
MSADISNKTVIENIDTNNNEAKNNKENAFDMSNIKLERGDTPQDIKDRCYQLCRNYLADVWLTVGIDDIEVKRLSGGLTNQLYYCAINDIHRTNDASAPQEVAIRLYQTKHFNENERTSDMIIGLMVSQCGLGPKLYGVFPDGQIQKYYKHKSFRKEQQTDPKLVEELAEKLARIHAMDVPISKTTHWMFNYFENYYRDGNETFDMPALINETNSETLQKFDLRLELDWLKNTIVKFDSPVTFTHVDFRGSNIMVTEDDSIVLCDFEYSCYDYRGYDFGTIFIEWGQKFWGDKDDDKPYEFTDDSQIVPFLETYILESTKLLGDKFANDPRNNVKRMIREVKLFSMVSMMFIVLFMYRMKESIFNTIEFNKKQQMAMTEKTYKAYQDLKSQFMIQNAFNTDLD